MNFKEMLEALMELEKERNLSKELIIKTIEDSLNIAYKLKGKSEKKEGEEDDALADLGKHIELNGDTGVVELVSVLLVVDEVKDPDREISLEDIRKMDPDFNVGDIVELRDPPPELGWKDSHNAKQNIVQRLKEAERDMLIDKFEKKKHQLVTGTIQKIEMRERRVSDKDDPSSVSYVSERYIHCDLGRMEGIMYPADQVPNESYKQYDKLKVLVLETSDSKKDNADSQGKIKRRADPIVRISRSHPELVERLFEMEVPEIGEKIVEIKSIAREAGSRTKVAVASNDSEIEPVGACVGTKGARVENIVAELRGERLDIIKWSPDPEQFITNSLSPAKVLRTYINEEEKSSTVIVPDDMLSLAIGKEGQNVRLAAKLTKWKIDIKSESQIKESISADLFKSGLIDSPDESPADEVSNELFKSESDE